MTTTMIKELLEAGAHFGHQSHKWEPKMRKFIFDKRNGIHIINLEITVKYLEKACAYITDLASKGKKILFVGTKVQAKEAIMKTSQDLNMPYVSERWLGGMLTNIKTIRQSVEKLEKFIRMDETGEINKFSKKEQSMVNKEKTKLVKNLSGVKHMSYLPDAMFIIDPTKEMIAVLEAKKLKIPIIAIIDTNCDPDLIDYPIPANDDSMKTIQYILEKVKESVTKGSEIWIKNEEDKKAEEAKIRAEEENRKKELKKKADQAKKAKENMEAEQKAKADAIIEDLEKSEKFVK